MRRAIKIIGLFLGLCLLVFAGIAWWAADAAQHVPEFYQVAVESKPADLQQQTQELQDRFQKLSDQVSQVGEWEATFTTDQINAWLASELSHQFPNVLPTGTEDPRVSLQDGKVLVAARYRKGRIDSVISFELQATLTDEPNVMALRVNNLRAGALPIPIHHFADKISKAASKGDVSVGWQQDEEDLVALVTVPMEHDRYVRGPVMIETLSLMDGEIFLAGRTGPQAHTVWNPEGPIYRLVKVSRREIDQH